MAFEERRNLTRVSSPCSHKRGQVAIRRSCVVDHEPRDTYYSGFMMECFLEEELPEMKAAYDRGSWTAGRRLSKRRGVLGWSEAANESGGCREAVSC